jgi:lysophospholipase L1-like esterase
VSRLLVVGHSVAEGGGSSTPQARYSALLADALGLRERNLAVGGAITCWEQGGRSPGDGGWEHVVASVRPDPSVRACIAHYGLNDLPVLGPAGLRPLQEALRTVLVRLRAGAAGRARRLRRSVAFEGQSVDVVMAVAPGFDGVVRVDVDGSERAFALRGEELCDTVTGRTNGVTLSIAGLGEGRHALRVGGAPGAVWMGWSTPSAAPPPVLVPLGHRVLDWGWYAGWPHGCTDADVPVLDAALREVVEGFGVPGVATLDLDGLLGKDPALFAKDRFYPNDEGHRRIAEALARSLRALGANGRS